MSITCFEDIDAWKMGRRMSQALDRVAGQPRASRNRRLLGQMEDCADSAMSNIVEGFDSRSDPEFLRFLKLAFRSVTEFQSHLHTALDKRQLDKPAFTELYDLATQTKSLIGGFMRYLKACIRQSKK